MNISEIIITCRKRAGLSRADLADEIGVTYNAVWTWESGRSCPSADNLIRICQATGHELVIQKKYDGGYLPKWTRRKKSAPAAEQ